MNPNSDLGMIVGSGPINSTEYLSTKDTERAEWSNVMRDKIKILIVKIDSSRRNKLTDITRIKITKVKKADR